jgi:hypothetical protein
MCFEKNPLCRTARGNVISNHSRTNSRLIPESIHAVKTRGLRRLRIDLSAPLDRAQEQHNFIIFGFRKRRRRHTLLPLDDSLYALQATNPHLTRSSLHRCLEQSGISRLPEVEGSKAGRKKFQRYPIGYFHVDLAEVRTNA